MTCVFRDCRMDKITDVSDVWSAGCINVITVFYQAFPK